ncbi:transglycosylase family protein [Streptomyces sp. NPDC046831]|uniref:transglycosylase family protein n=1 Tax=Streptomyces sp. NPDC046831 TaxID=3154805 RepID=UPI00340C0D31
MLSGNGRHRRPRQAPAVLVAAGVTGSAIAIPLLGASGASAAEGTTWDKVAECESGGSWSADNGNGYYGGLQLSQEDWDKYGGLTYAPSADQASRSQQIAVAEKILDDRGPGAWPTCGLLSGLHKDTGSADVDTGVGNDSSSSSGSSRSTGSPRTPDSGLSGEAGDSTRSPGDARPSSGADSSPSSGSAADSRPKAPSSGSSASSSAKTDDPAESGTSAPAAPRDTQAPGSSPSVPPRSDDSDNWEQTGGSSALVDTGALGTGRHRGGSAAEDPAENLTAASAGRHAVRETDDTPAAGGSYIVRAGDSLASIADSLDLDGGWHALYAANRAAIGSDPNSIVTGQTLDVGTENARK